MSRASWARGFRFIITSSMFLILRLLKILMARHEVRQYLCSVFARCSQGLPAEKG